MQNSSVSTGAPRVVVAGGHSAGHIEPAMNSGDALRLLEPAAEITGLDPAWIESVTPGV